MGDREQVLSLGAVGLGEGDEGAAGVVETAVGDRGELEVAAEAFADLVLGADGSGLAVAVRSVAAAGAWARDDEIVGGRGPADRLLEAEVFPAAEHELEQRVDRDLAGRVGLGVGVVAVSDEQLGRGIGWFPVTPAQAGDLAEAQAGEEADRVEDAAIGREIGSADQSDDLVALVHRARAPLGIFVAGAAEVFAVNIAGVLIDDLLVDEIVE